MTEYTTPASHREVCLAEHVDNELNDGNFSTVEVKTQEPGDGEVLVRADYLSMSAAFKDLMKVDCQLPMPPWKIGDRAGAGGIGTVVRSGADELAVGDVVQTTAGWSEYWAGPAGEFFRVDPTPFPSPQYLLSQGPTAHYGMVEIARVDERDVVFVSGAAGGVGSLAGQIAKCRGAAKVIGSAGSQDKVDYLVDELGYDAAFDYHDGPVVEQLRRHAPDGISVFFDNVGGEQFEAAVQLAVPRARFALCGALSGQNGASVGSFPRLDLMTSITRHIELRPFACYHTPEQIGAWSSSFGQWLSEGRFEFPHTRVEGDITDAPGTLVSLLEGKYRGNVALKISD